LGSSEKYVQVIEKLSITGVDCKPLERQLLRCIFITWGGQRAAMRVSIAKMLVQTVGMFYGFHGRPYLWVSGDIGPCRKGSKNEFRNGTDHSRYTALGFRAPPHYQNAGEDLGCSLIRPG